MTTPTIQQEPALATGPPAAGGGVHTPPAARLRPFSRPELAFLIGVPLAWAVLLLFHPSGDGQDIYADLNDQVTPWLTVHIGQMLFLPAFAVAIDLLLRGIGGTAARVSRIALVPFVIFYTAFEMLQGIGTGILVHSVNGLAEAQRATGAVLVQDYAENILIRDAGIFVSIGGCSLVIAAVAAGMALYRQAAAPVAVPLLLGLAGLLVTAHPPPYGPAGLVLFVIAVLIHLRSRPAAVAQAAVT